MELYIISFFYFLKLFMKDELYLIVDALYFPPVIQFPLWRVFSGTRKGILPNLLLCTRKLLLLTTLYDESYDLSSVCVHSRPSMEWSAYMAVPATSL